MNIISNFKILLPHIVATLLLCQASYAQTEQTDFQDAFRNAVAFGVDQKSHASFWTNLSTADKRNILDSGFVDSLALGQTWQFAFWESASKTVRAQRVIRTENYDKTYLKLQELGRYQVILDKSENMLRAISKGEPIVLPPGTPFFGQTDINQLVLDEFVTDEIRDNVGVAFDRAQVLLSQQWPPKQKTFLYPEQGLKYFSSVRLAFSEADLEVPGLRAWEAKQSIGKDNILELLSVDYSKARDVSFDHETVLLGLDQMGIEHSPFGRGTWLGLPFEESSVLYTIGSERFHAILRTITDLEHERTYSVTLTSNVGLLDAANQMQLFMFKLSYLNNF